MSEPYYKIETLEPMKSIGFLIKRCGVMMSQLAERRFESQQISFTQWLVLIRLRFRAHMSATQLSDEMGHDMGALTRVVDSLERAGFVRRERSQHDRRAVEIAITPEGRSAVEATLGFVVDMLNQLVEPFSDREVDTLIALLQRTLARLQDLADTAGKAPAAGAATAAPAPSRGKRGAASKAHGKSAGGKP